MTTSTTSTALEALRNLARAYDEAAARQQGQAQLETRREAAQLRLVATLHHDGKYDERWAWDWADAGAGRLARKLS